MSIAGLFEAAMRTIMIRDVRKHLLPCCSQSESISEAQLSSWPDVNDQLRLAFVAAEAIGWRAVTEAETGYFKLTPEESNVLLPLCVASTVAHHHALSFAGDTPAGAHCGWLTPQSKLRGRYTFLRKAFAEFLAYRRFLSYDGGRFMRSGTLPRVVSLAPTWHLPLRLLIDDVASRHAQAATGHAVSESGSVVMGLLGEMSRLLVKAINAPALANDFFVRHKDEYMYHTGWVQRRLPAFAASEHASIVRQVIAMLHLLHRKHPLALPVGAATTPNRIRDAAAMLVVLLTSQFGLGALQRVTEGDGLEDDIGSEMMVPRLPPASLMHVGAEQLDDASPTFDSEIMASVPHHERVETTVNVEQSAACVGSGGDQNAGSLIVALHALLCVTATGDAEFLQFIVAASPTMRQVAHQHGDAMWAATQLAMARCSPEKKQRLIDALREFTDVTTVSLCAAAAAGDVELIRMRLATCDTNIIPEQLFTAAELCINGGLWSELHQPFEQAFANVPPSPTPHNWLSFLTTSHGPAAPQSLDISGLLKHVSIIGSGFGRSSAQLRLVAASRTVFAANVPERPDAGDANDNAAAHGLHVIIGEGHSQITEVGDSFLAGCTGLTAVDLTPLAHLTSIGHSFLSSCTGLTAVDLTPLAL